MRSNIQTAPAAIAAAETTPWVTTRFRVTRQDLPTTRLVLRRLPVTPLVPTTRPLAIRRCLTAAPEAATQPIGALALSNNTTGITNTALGFNVTTADNVIVIGTNVGDENVDHGCFIGEIFGQTSSSGIAVFIDSNGRLGTAKSSRRFKEGIKPMEQASEALFALKPVRFYYKKEIDPTRTSQFGLVAEDVEKVEPALVVRDKEGKPYSVRYDQVNAMLLNEFLKEHCKVEEQSREILEQRATITELKKGIATVVAELKEQASQIQKVTAQLATASPSHRGLRTSKLAGRRIRASGPTPQLVNQSLKPRPPRPNSSIRRSAVTFHRVAPLVLRAHY